MLGGKLRRFEEYDHDDRWKAHLSLDIYVIANETRDVVYTLRFDESEPAGRRHPAAIAEAMSTLVERLLEVLLEELRTEL